MQKIIELIKNDPLRMSALDVVYQLHLPQCYIAAGFVRNLVWDKLHNKSKATPLNDIDVIYFDLNEIKENQYLEYEGHLKQLMPEVNWQVCNQAKMNERNNDLPYKSTIDAMSYWPEKETAVAVRKIENEQYECISAFGFESLFNCDITHNPKRERGIFKDRVESKNWLKIWPKLIIKV